MDKGVQKAPHYRQGWSVSLSDSVRSGELFEAAKASLPVRIQEKVNMMTI